jgi:hypothetical protein
VSADQLNGYVPVSLRAGDGRVYARLSRLALARATSRNCSTSATSIPALDIVVDDFGVRGKLGRWVKP